MKKTKNLFDGIRPHGRTFEGTVISAKAQKTATIEWTFTRKVPKYERYEKQRTRVKAHNPPSIAAEKGDQVKIQECRPLSKTKNFIIIEKIGKNVAYLEKEEAMSESKFKKPKKELENLQEDTDESN